MAESDDQQTTTISPRAVLGSGPGLLAQRWRTHGLAADDHGITIALVDLGVQYRLNIWNRAMFDGLDKRDGSGVLYQSMIFFPLILASVGVGVADYLCENDAAAQVARLAERARARSMAHQRPLLSTQLGSG